MLVLVTHDGLWKLKSAYFYTSARVYERSILLNIITFIMKICKDSFRAVPYCVHPLHCSLIWLHFVTCLTIPWPPFSSTRKSTEIIFPHSLFLFTLFICSKVLLYYNRSKDHTMDGVIILYILMCGEGWMHLNVRIFLIMNMTAKMVPGTPI